MVFTVPMRNWNLFLKFLYAFIRSSFYSTYEELKQDCLVFNKPYMFSFYSTYEELKLC